MLIPIPLLHLPFTHTYPLNFLITHAYPHTTATFTIYSHLPTSFFNHSFMLIPTALPQLPFTHIYPLDFIILHRQFFFRKVWQHACNNWVQQTWVTVHWGMCERQLSLGHHSGFGGRNGVMSLLYILYSGNCRLSFGVEKEIKSFSCRRPKAWPEDAWRSQRTFFGLECPPQGH